MRYFQNLLPITRSKARLYLYVEDTAEFLRAFATPKGNHRRNKKLLANQTPSLSALVLSVHGSQSKTEVELKPSERKHSCLQLPF